MIQEVLQSLYDTPFATAIRESDVTFPALESIHVLAIALMAGTIAIVDLRLLGLLLVDVPAADIERRIVPVVWVGFALMAATGFLLFSAEAAKLGHNPAFLAKTVLLLLAGVNMLAFHRFQRPVLAQADGALPVGVKFGAAFSLLLWTGVIAAGRAIAYFH